MDPDWNDFRVLLALSRGGSVAAAARELKVDQSTVSRRLAAIEEAFGCLLLVRGGREFSWTAEGRTALAAAEAVEAAILAATQRLHSSRVESAGVVRVSVTPGNAVILLDILPRFQDQYPDLKLDLTGTTERVDLAKGEADIAFRFGDPTGPDLIARHVTKGGWCLFGSEPYLQAHGNPKSTADLPRHHLVLYVASMHRVASGLRWLEEFNREDTVITRVDNLQAAWQMIAIGRGLGVLPVFFEHTNPGLVRALPEPVVFSNGYRVYHASLRNVTRVRAALDVLSAAIEAHSHMWTGLRPVPEAGTGR